MRNRSHCPGCNQYIRKRRGDRLLRCHTCGWTEGWPVLRWVTHYPRRFWRRTAFRRRRILGELQTTVKWLLILWIIGSAAGVGVPAVPDVDIDIGDGALGDGRELGSTGSPTATPAETAGAVAESDDQEQTSDQGEIDSDGDNIPNYREQELNDANPWRKDLYLTVVYGKNVEPLTDSQVNNLERRFSQMPVSNPDGTTGIRLHVLNQTEADEEIIWDKSSVETLRREYYTEKRLGDRECEAHMVVIGESVEEDTWGRGRMPGHFVVTDGTHDYTTQSGETVETMGTIHELLHNIVGEFPTEYDNVSTSAHTNTGYLSHAEEFDEIDHLSQPTRTILSNRGFAKPAENVINSC